jgi:hypothetical protein
MKQECRRHGVTSCSEGWKDMACLEFKNASDPRDLEYAHADSAPLVSDRAVALPSGRKVVLLDRRAVPPNATFHGEHPVTYIVMFATPADPA